MEKEKQKKETHFGCIFFSRRVTLPAEYLPNNTFYYLPNNYLLDNNTYYPEQRESRYGLSYNQTVWYSCLHANLGYDSSESLMVWHCTYQMRILQMQ